MKHYKIYEHPAGDIEAVKVGWSWPGLLLGLLWVLFKRLWWVVGYLFAILFGLAFLHVLFVGELTTEKMDTLVIFGQVIFHCLVGEVGNGWVQERLKVHGYEYQGIETAANPEAATALYVKQKEKDMAQREEDGETALQSARTQA